MPARIAQPVALCGNLSFMEIDVSGSSSVRKEITCTDCGHIYLVAQGQQSSRCQNCGNIEFLPGEKAAPEKLKSLSHQIVAKRVLPRLDKGTDFLLPFRATPDAMAVEELRMRYQVEWQLWAVLVKNFQSPVYHMAYFCQATVANQLEQAAERYRQHRAVMALLPDSRWQAEVAELMLSRIESLSIVRMNAEGQGWWAQLPSRFLMLRTDSQIMRYSWIGIGIIVFVKLFSVVWWK